MLYQYFCRKSSPSILVSGELNFINILIAFDGVQVESERSKKVIGIAVTIILYIL